MASVRIGISGVYHHPNLIKWMKGIELHVGSKIADLEKRLLTGVKKHFSTKASGPSRPGTFPYKLSGQASDAIQTTRYVKPGFIGFKIGTKASHAGTRLPRLKGGFVISPKDRGCLAVPVSYEARLHSSKWNGKRSNWVKSFPRKLEFVSWSKLAVDKKDKQKSVRHQATGMKSSVGFLGEFLSETNRPATKASMERQASAFSREITARSLVGRGGDSRTGKYITTAKGKQYKVHYILTRKSFYVSPRLGVEDALRIELDQIGKVF